jgi:uncharacterized protein YciI
MTTTTSHGSPGSGAAVPPLRREVIVAADRDLAFRVFTERIGAWWPLAEHSVHGADATVAFVDPGVGARIVETIDGAEDATWGTVSRWEPGEAIAFTWHPRPRTRRCEPRPRDVHRRRRRHARAARALGWEAFGDRAPEARANYGQGWPVVLDAYASLVGRMSDDDTWVALMHRPADPSVTGGVFADPRFSDHVAFLQRMAEAGYLVAAGSLADRPGEGMTVLRLPGPDRLDEATRLATEDDASVASGLLHRRRTPLAGRDARLTPVQGSGGDPPGHDVLGRDPGRTRAVTAPRKSARSRAHSRTSVTAVTVAVRGTSRSRPISPKKSPAVSRRTTTSPWLTSTSPSTIT